VDRIHSDRFARALQDGAKMMIAGIAFEEAADHKKNEGDEETRA